MVEQLKTVEIDVEKGIFRVNGKDLENYAGYLRIECEDGIWSVSDKSVDINDNIKNRKEYIPFFY